MSAITIPEHAAELMRKVVDQPDWAAQLGRQMGKAILSTYSPEKVCAQLLAELDSTR